MSRNIQPDSSHLTTTKKILFVVVAVIAFFGLLEIVLALAGVRPVIREEDPYVGFESYLPLFTLGPESRQWTTASNKLEFFNAQSFPDRKAPGTYRVFTLGGSTTYGRPFEDATSFSGWLRTYLRAVAPDKRWELINCGAVSYASYRVAKVMEELLEHEPDLFIVYSGNNEFLEQRSYSDITEQPHALRRVTRVLSHLRTYALARKVRRLGTDRAQKKYELTGEVEEILNRSSGLDVYVRDDPLREQILAHYRFNLARMAEMAKSVAASMILVSVPVNEKDFPPFKSQFSDGLAEQQRSRVESRLHAAREALRAGDPGRARDDLLEAVKIDPRYADTSYLLGRASYALNAVDEAESAFHVAIEEDVCPLRALDEMNEIIASTADLAGIPWVDFRSALRQASRSSTGDDLLGNEQFLDHVHPTVETNGFLARMLVEQMGALDIVELSEDWLDRVGNEVATEVEGHVDAEAQAHAYKNLSKVLIWAGKTEEAERYVQLATELTDDDWEVRYNAGMIEMEAEDPEAAIASFEEAVRLNPNAALAYDRLGAAYAAVGKIDEAIVSGQHAARLDPGLAIVHSNLSASYLTAGQVDRAAASAQKALEIDPEMAEAYNNLGNVRFATEKYEDALRDYEEAVRRRPGYAEAWTNKGLVLGQLGRFQDAVAAFERVLKLEPKRAEAYEWLARTYLIANREPEGQEALNRGLRAAPDSAALHLLQGQLFAGRQRFDEAEVHFRRAIELSDRDSRSAIPGDQLHHGLATVLLSSGRVEEGVAELNRAAKINPRNPMVQNDLGLVYEGTGRFEKALQYYRRALELEPGLALAENNIRRVQTRRGER